MAAGMERLGDDTSAPSTADAREVVRSEANTGPETSEVRIVPDPPGADPEQSAPAWTLSRLLLKISADPIEISRVLQNFVEIISERVVGEIRAFRREFETRLDVQDAKIDALYKLYDGLRSEINGLRKEIRLLMAVCGIQTVLLGALLTMGIMDLCSTDRVPASSTSGEVQASEADAEESSAALRSQSPASDLASEDADRPGVDAEKESKPSISPAR